MASLVIRRMVILYVIGPGVYELCLICPVWQYISCPLHKRNFSLTQGDCLNDPQYQILAFEAREDPDCSGDIQLLLPPKDDIDVILGTEKWLVRQAQSEALGLNEATQIDIVGLQGNVKGEESCQGGGCGSNKLEW
jgi:nitrite reductase (NAD(P)H)